MHRTFFYESYIHYYSLIQTCWFFYSYCDLCEQFNILKVFISRKSFFWITVRVCLFFCKEYVERDNIENWDLFIRWAQCPMGLTWIKIHHVNFKEQFRIDLIKLFYDHICLSTQSYFFNPTFTFSTSFDLATLFTSYLFKVGQSLMVLCGDLWISSWLQVNIWRKHHLKWRTLQ